MTMIKISNDNIVKSEIDFNYQKISLKELKEVSEYNNYHNLFYSKYPLFINPDIAVVNNEKLNQLVNKYYSHKMILYNHVSSNFIPDYVNITRIKSEIIDKKNILSFNTDIGILESLLYLYTENNIINKNKFYLYTIHGKTHKSDKLINNFEGEDIRVENGNINYDDTIKKYQNKDIDFVHFNYVVNIVHNTVDYKVDFEIMVITLSILKKNGVYVFKDMSDTLESFTNAKNYLTHKLSFLNNHFGNIRCMTEKVKGIFQYIFVCNGFKGCPDTDINNLKNILQKWNEVKYDKSKEGIIISKLFGKINSEIKDTVNSLSDSFKVNREKNIKFVKSSNFETLDKYFKDTIQFTYDNHIKLAGKYDLKLSKYFYSFGKNYDFEKNIIYLFGEPQSLTYIQPITNKVTLDINSVKKDFIHQFDEIKRQIILYKIGIDSLDADKWNKLTYMYNISSGLLKYTKEKGLKLSRAFFKMYEILDHFNFFSKHKADTINSIHICEAPGHFINSTFNYINNRHPNKKFEWYGNSLNPKNEQVKKKYGDVLDDSYGFIKKYPDRWLWGADDTGDITSRANIEFFKKKFAGKFDFLTSDCGLGAKGRFEYHSQEEMMGKINFAQFLISLIVTKMGGSIVLKYFMPFTKPVSISLLYLLRVHFKYLTIHKPLMTSPTNNEVYIVCRKKVKELTEDNYRKLVDFLDKYDMDKYLYDEIDEIFINNTIYVSKKIINDQIDNIKVIYYHYDKEYDYDALKVLGKAYAKQWIRKYKFDKVKPL